MKLGSATIDFINGTVGLTWALADGSMHSTMITADDDPGEVLTHLKLDLQIVERGYAPSEDDCARVLVLVAGVVTEEHLASAAERRAAEGVAAEKRMAEKKASEQQRARAKAEDDAAEQARFDASVKAGVEAYLKSRGL